MLRTSGFVFTLDVLIFLENVFRIAILLETFLFLKEILAHQVLSIPIVGHVALLLRLAGYPRYLRRKVIVTINICSKVCFIQRHLLIAHEMRNLIFTLLLNLLVQRLFVAETLLL